MKKINWKLMRPQDIEIRPAMVKDGKATLLLYQDSRNTMDALDENFGEFGWQISYKDVGGQIYGCLSILNEDTGEWVSKEDTGSESNIDAAKGLSSDILKRCAVRFGYGRELYSAPRIVVEDDKYGNTGYKVSSITYNDNREISSLTIVNRFGKEVFSWALNNASKTSVQPSPMQRSEAPKCAYTQDMLKDFCRAQVNAGNDKEQTKKFFNFYSTKLEGWQNRFDAETLYNKWLSRAYNNSNNS